MSVEPLKYIRRIESLEVRTFLYHKGKGVKGAIKRSQQRLDDFMLGDLSGAESLKLICDVGEAIKHELDIFIVVSLEAVEEIVKNTDPLVSLCRDAFIDLG